MKKAVRLGVLIAIAAAGLAMLHFLEPDPYADAIAQLEASPNANAGAGSPHRSVGAPVDKAAVLQGVPTVIGPVAQPPRPEMVPNRVAFLPLAHRDKRFARAFGHGYHATLATHAAMVLGRDVVDPTLAVTVVRRLGNNHWWALPNHFEYTDEILRKAAKRLGAGAVVYGELHADGRIRLDALAIADGADIGPWREIEIPAPSETPLDATIWNGPRFLLEQLTRNGRLPHPTRIEGASSATDEHDAAIRHAMELFWSGDLGLMRRAETILARTAVADVGRPDALVELAFIRAVRPMLFEHEAFSGVLRDGPNPARHLAWLHGALSEAQRQRLRFVDHLYVGHVQSDREFERFVASLPQAAPERALLAVLYENRGRASVASDAARPPGSLGRALLQIAATTGKDEREALATRVVSDAANPDVFHTPLLIEIMRERAVSRGDWGDRRLWSMSRVPFAAREAMETLRSACQLLDAPQRISCIEPVHDLLAEYVDALPPGDVLLGDDESWEFTLDSALGTWAAFALPDHPVHALPDKEVLETDPVFAAQWYAISRLIGVSHETFADREATLGSRRGAAELLMSDARTRMHHALEWLFDSAYQAAWVGKARGQADEYLPYLDLLDSISRENPYAMWKRTYFYRDLGRTIEKNLSRVHLVSYDPFDPRFIDSHTRPDGKASAYNAKWLGAAVPMPDDTLARVADDWIRAGEYERARDMLEARYRTHTNDHLALELDDAMHELRAAPEVRLSVAERALRAFPGRQAVALVAANRMTDARRYAEAKRLYGDLRRNPSYFTQACLALGRLAVLEKRVHEMEPILADCAANAPTKWKARTLWSKVGEIRSDRDDFEGALEAYGMAKRAVGGAGDVLKGMAFNHALLGHEEAARKWYDDGIRIYDSDVKPSGRNDLARHLLSRGKAEEALAVLESVLEGYEYPNYETAELLLATHFALDRFDDFRKTCQRIDTDTCDYRLGVGYWEALRDRDAALKHLERFRKKRPHDTYGVVEIGRIHLEAGDLEAAKQAVDEAIATEPDLKVLARLATKVWIASGDVDRALDFAKDRLERMPDSIASWEARARVAIAQGKHAQARRAIQNAAKRLYPWRTFHSARYWFDIQNLWLLESELVGIAGTREDDLILARNLERAAIRTVVHGDVWEALYRVKRHLGDEAGAARAFELARQREPALGLARASLPAALP